MTDTDVRPAATAADRDDRDRLYIDGAWVPSTGTGRIEVRSASTEEVIGSVPEGTPEDVDRAVAAARHAFDAWSQTPVEERAQFLDRINQGLASRIEHIARLIASEVGMPLTMSTAIQAGLPIMTSGQMAQIVRGFPFEEEVGNSLVVREPVGVVGCITPWNYPLHQVVNKVAPALAAGCTVVLKPSEVAPFTAFVLAEIIDEAGVPAGVFNLVTGTGPVVGEAIVTHPDVDAVSFTGSTRAGKRIAELAAATVKRVTLEMGGKSANLILAGADLEKAVRSGVNNAFLNSGQTCTALTRMLVPRDQQADAERIAADQAAKLTVGDPFDDASRLGPLVSDVQRERVRGYIRKGVEEGARLVVGGAGAPEGLPRGYYVQPTIFADVRPDMAIAQEEIFGPVLSIIPYDTEEDAVRIANDTVYGLAGAVWAGDVAHAEQVARRLRTGQVDVNGGRFNPMAPFGGFKQSGVGRELGRFGLEEFLEVKSLQR
ncbi:MAG TPA: aldehyde dehydrogenase family protein [Candidatus Angelobacter sp.]|jgi:aldehyde dehydrogenase (NAD+)|nr:aldehyde dehydrogenase family protein [Candidatus Angelobacter sp.]